MDKLQADKLTEIRKALAAATPGEWSVEEDDYGLTVMAADPQHPGRSASVFGFDSEIYVREEDVDLIAHAPEYITYLLQLVETQAQALEESEGMSKRWEKAFVNADKQYLKMEKEAAGLRRALEEVREDRNYHQTRATKLSGESTRLRKALEEVRTSMEDALSVMEMEGRDFNLMPQSTIQEAVENLEALTQV